MKDRLNDFYMRVCVFVAAKQLSAKSAMARFKEMDLNSEAGQR